MRLLPTSQRAKASIELAIACDVDGAAKPPVRRPTGEAFRVLYVGQFLHLKGMHLGLPAFAKLLQARPTARLTMIGEGPEGTRWRRLAERLGVAAHIEWIPWLRQDKLAELYASHDVLLFPSLHDPGGMVVLESMAHGLPVVCLNIGGPGIIVTPACGRVIDVMGRSKAAVVASLAQALIELADPRTRSPLAEEALQRRKDFSWKAKIAKLYGPPSQPLIIAN
jgi:glycosyltransferase involved in cell wall biosynthesis